MFLISCRRHTSRAKRTSLPKEASRSACGTHRWKKPNAIALGFFLAPPTGLEPVTPWLTVRCSTDWAMEDYEILHKFDVLDLFEFPYISPWYVLCSHYRLSYGGLYEERLDFHLTSVVCWRIPIFPDRRQSSIFGTTELNFCVRNGNRWTLCVNHTN